MADYQYLKPSLGLTDYPTTINNLVDILEAADTKIENVTQVELEYLDITTLGLGAHSKAVVLDTGEDYIWPATGILTYGILKDSLGTTLTSTISELNYLDLTVAIGTASPSEAVVLDASKDFTGINNLTATTFIGALTGTASNATTAVTLTGLTSTISELNYLDLTAAIGTASPSEAVVLDASKDFTGINNLTATTFIGALTGTASNASYAASAGTAVSTTGSNFLVESMIKWAHSGGISQNQCSWATQYTATSSTFTTVASQLVYVPSGAVTMEYYAYGYVTPGGTFQFRTKTASLTGITASTSSTLPAATGVGTMGITALGTGWASINIELAEATGAGTAYLESFIYRFI